MAMAPAILTVYSCAVELRVEERNSTIPFVSP